MSAFIFDMDGTLADTMPYHQQSWDELLPQLGLTVDRDEFFAWTAGLTNREIFPRLLQRTLDEAELAELAERKEASYRRLYAPHVQAMPGAVAYLERAARAGIKLAVGTAAPPPNVALVLDGALDLRRHFQAVVGAADVQRGKPDPEIFLRAAELLGAPAERCIVFEDAPAGIEAARRAGMRCVVVTTTLDEAQVRALPNVEHVLCCVADFNDPRLVPLIDEASA